MKLTIIVISNASRDDFTSTLLEWENEGFELGVDLFICGPANQFRKFSLQNTSSIIDYDDPQYYGKYFHINHKKYYAGNQTKSDYIYFVHDRFRPQKGFKHKLTNKLRELQPSFGAVTVYNLNGTQALGELRLKKGVSHIGLSNALMNFGRLAVPA